MQFADLNIDGYPEMILLASINGGTNSAIVYENTFGSGGTFSVFGTYNDKVKSSVDNQPILSISFFDILDNGYLPMHSESSTSS